MKSIIKQLFTSITGVNGDCPHCIMVGYLSKNDCNSMVDLAVDMHAIFTDINLMFVEDVWGDQV